MSDDFRSFDQMPRYVRVRSEPDSAFVEFDFAIGFPDLFVELVMPKDAFEIFSARQDVTHMDKSMADAVDADMRKWRYGDNSTE